MRVDDLPRGRNQPFYSVLVDLRDKPGNWTTYGTPTDQRISFTRRAPP